MPFTQIVFRQLQVDNLEPVMFGDNPRRSPGSEALLDVVRPIDGRQLLFFVRIMKNKTEQVACIPDAADSLEGVLERPHSRYLVWLERSCELTAVFTTHAAMGLRVST